MSWRAGLVFLLAVAAAGTAQARSERDFGYTAPQIWPALVRFVRVDEGLKIVEKDADSGYVIFGFVEHGKTFRGAAELARVGDSQTRVVIRIADRPSYMEEGMLDRLTQKLRQELGEPLEPSPPQPPPAPAAPPGDAGLR